MTATSPTHPVVAERVSTKQRGAGDQRQHVRTQIVIALLVVTAIKQIVHALIYPPFQGHDEVAHLSYLRVVAEDQRIPTFSDTLPRALERYSAFTLDWPALYTANHPPLYYVISWPVYQLAGDGFLSQLYAVRFVAIPLFLLVVWLSYLLARTLFPADDFLTLTVPAVVAFQPQLSFEGAIVNNDMLSIALATLVLYLCAVALRHGLSHRLALLLGVAIGLGLLSKATLTSFLPVVAGVALYCRWPRPWEQARDARWWRGSVERAGLLITPALLLPLPWYFYLRRTYGDFTAFEATRELQSDWNRPAGTFSELLFSGDFHLERLRESWGYYGWKRIPPADGEVLMVSVALMICAVGLVVGLVRFFANREPALSQREERIQVASVIMLAAVCLLMYGAMTYFGTMFLLTQARYVFPAFPAAIVLAMLGLRGLLPFSWLRPSAAVVVGIAGLFQFMLLSRAVLPYAFS